MLQNIYMLPYLFHDPVELLEIWHSSNLEQPEYLLEVEEFLDEPTVDERKWMKNEFWGKRFEELRTGYIATYKALLGERDIGKRRKILNDWRQYEQRFFE
jgi:hypothetical protein